MALLMFSQTQFSIFRLASSHMPAHAVALTHASQAGTVESVKCRNVWYSSGKPRATIKSVMIQCCLSE